VGYRWAGQPEGGKLIPGEAYFTSGRGKPHMDSSGTELCGKGGFL